MRRTLLGVLLSVAMSLGLVQVMKVEPVKASWSGRVHRLAPYNYVAQGITCNFDEPIYAEYFTGTATSQQYQVQMVIPGTVPLVVVAHGDTTIAGDHKWVRCYFHVDRPDSIIKGRTYQVRWTLASGTDSLMYYYDSTDKYKHGEMVVGDQVPVPNPFDLACRVMGRLKAVDRSFLGGFAKLPGYNDGITNRRAAWQYYMSQTGWGTAPFDCNWEEHQPTQDSWDFRDTDAHISYIRSTGAQPVGILVKSALWASSREDTTWVPDGDTWIKGYGPVAYGAPLNLWPGVGETNYYALWIDSLMNHAANVHTWIISNEPNDTCVSESCWADGVTGWWRRPNRLQYLSGFDGPRGLCSLYMRMCYVANQRIRAAAGHDTDRILIGAMHRATDSNDSFLIAGVHWLDLCYQTSEDSIFWDGVAEHPYQDGHFGFSPEELELTAETLRAVMRDHGHYDGQLWNTEFGWNKRQIGLRAESDANNLCQAFVTSFGLPASPGAGGGYDRMCWWLPYWHFAPIEIEEPWNWLWLQDDTTDGVSLIRQYGYYAFKQACSALVGKRFNGRVTTGDDETDSIVRMYEFEDTATLKKTWVCWRSDGGVQDVAVELPARADSAYIEALAYQGGTPPNQMRQADSYGWLGIGVADRPQFVTEPANESITRPELAVDSSTATTVRRRMARWLRPQAAAEELDSRPDKPRIA
jgi:hypothetical protein